MAIIIHQITCGEQNKAWELLKSTLKDNSLAKKIAFQTDLQDSPPSGINWTPIIRGFLYGDHYLIIKTYPDNSPNVRNGRVFSHCLVIDKKYLKDFTDLTPLLQAFNPSLDKSFSLTPLSFEDNYSNNIILGKPVQQRFNKIVRHFSGFCDNQKPIVWVGQSDYDMAVCKLWHMLSPNEREQFHFGIKFDPNELSKQLLYFVVIPETLETKFDNKGYLIIRRDDSVELKGLSETYFSGDPDSVKRIKAIQKELGINLQNAKDIETISKCVPTFENLFVEKDIKLLNTFVNIVALFSPNINTGSKLKDDILQNVRRLMEDAVWEDMFVLRNFPTASFLNSEMYLSEAFSIWANKNLFDEVKNTTTTFAQFITNVSKLTRDGWLYKSLFNSIREYFSIINPTKTKIFWSWFSQDKKIILLVSEFIENSSTAEQCFCDTAPVFRNESTKEILLFARTRNWFKLHASILKSSTAFQNALEEQLKIDINNNYLEGIQTILNGVNPSDILKYSVANGDKRLINICGAFCRSQPDLLNIIRIENIYWQEVWVNAIEKGNDIFSGILSPKETVYTLFDLVVEGKPIIPALLEKIAYTQYSNTIEYQNRNILWSKLPINIRRMYLERTSGILLESLSKNPTIAIPEDDELSVYIENNAMPVFLYHNRNSIKNVLPLFSTYSHLNESMLRDYVHNYSGKIDIADATQLGQLVLNRQYSEVAEAIFQKSRTNHKFKIALNECHDLLSFMSKGIAWANGLLHDISVNENEWWDSFTQLAFTLYDGGPSQNKLWIQAGGKGYDLETSGSGKEVWIAALNKLRKGHCSGEISVISILNVMVSENKRNGELKTLKNLYGKL